MNYHYELKTNLQIHHKRITPNKLLIFDQLNNHTALTPSELFDNVSEKVDRATFYRILKQFRDYKIIKDTVINGVRKIELSDKFSSHHHHMICVKCGNVINIHDMKLEQYLKLLAARKGYLHRSHSFEIQGICPACSPRYQRLAQEGAAVNDDLATRHITG